MEESEKLEEKCEKVTRVCLCMCVCGVFLFLRAFIKNNFLSYKCFLFVFVHGVRNKNID